MSSQHNNLQRHIKWEEGMIFAVVYDENLSNCNVRMEKNSNPIHK